MNTMLIAVLVVMCYGNELQFSVTFNVMRYNVCGVTKYSTFVPLTLAVYY